MSSSTFHRRDALKTTAAIGAGFWMGTSADPLRAERSANEKLNVACIGIGAEFQAIGEMVAA